MKKTLLTLFICLIASFTFAGNILIEGFEYANHDNESPTGWICDDNSWLCGYLEKDHNRTAHSGNWYAYTDAEESWMFMPLFFSSQLRYRPSLWAISDGTYEVELWVGNDADPTAMTTLLITATVSSGNYEKFSEYVENLSSDFNYLGIHAIASEGAYHLTIDDIYVDMVERYELEITPYRFDTILDPGSQITIEYEVQNTGYEDLHVYMNPNTDFFQDISFTEDGFNYSSFPTVPNQTVHCTCTATLSPNLAPGTLCWLDIMFTVSCDCLTRMATLWVTVADPTNVSEQQAKVEIFPNPTTDFIQIKANGLQQVEVWDLMGRKVVSQTSKQDELRLDMSSLPSGMYFVTVVTPTGKHTEKVAKP